MTTPQPNNPTPEEQNEPGYATKVNKDGAWWTTDGINWYPLTETYHEPNNLNASEDWLTLLIDELVDHPQLCVDPECASWGHAEPRQKIEAAIREHIQALIHKARIDEWHLITDYIESSFSFDWYPADFKAYRDKRIADLKAGSNE